MENLIFGGGDRRFGSLPKVLRFTPGFVLKDHFWQCSVDDVLYWGSNRCLLSARQVT